MALAQSALQPPMQVVTGAPYSGEQVQERVATARDGSPVTQVLSSVKMYRDSAGRTRREEPEAVTIEDPVAAVRYTLNPQAKMARRVGVPRELMFPGDLPSPVIVISAGAGITVTGPAAGGAIGATLTTVLPGQSQPDTRQLVLEDLGTLKMEGLLVEGSRRTVTIPSAAPGNDRPIVTVTDTWISPDLKIVMLSKVTDPQSGETTTKMTHISRSEPDPRLFQVPPDYRMADAAGAPNLP